MEGPSLIPFTKLFHIKWSNIDSNQTNAILGEPNVLIYSISSQAQLKISWKLEQLMALLPACTSNSVTMCFTAKSF